MSRVATGDVVTVKATSNVYTALVGIALLVELIGLISMLMRFGELTGGGMGALFK